MYEDIAIALTIVLAIATVVMVYLGWRGLAKDVFIVRCEDCDHWMVSSKEMPDHSCSHCRHPRLWHPLRARHQQHYAPARVGEPHRVA